MALYNVFVQDSSPLFIYSPPGAWIDTPLELDNSPSLSYHATDIQGATVQFDFVGTGFRLFSAIGSTPGSYEVYVDGRSLSNTTDSSPRSDSQLLLGSISGLEMAPHTITLVNSGVSGNVLNLAHVELESVLSSGSSSLSAATFDDTVDEIQWGREWVSALGEPGFYNNTVHYTEQSDAAMKFSFNGDAIAVYGSTGTNMGDYTVTLDGQSNTFNGGSDGSARFPHDQTILYLANGLGSGRHELTITANPSSLGEPRVFNVDCIKVLSGDSSSGPILLPPGPLNPGTSSTLPPPVSTGSNYDRVISSTVLSMPTPLPTSTSSTQSPSLMSSSSTSPNVLATANFDNLQSDGVLRAASDESGFRVLTNKWLVSSAIISGIIAGIGVIFLLLFMWKRKNLDPPSYIDLEKGNGPDGEESPELPIQPAGEMSPEEGNPFEDFAPYAQHQSRGFLTDRKWGHSRDGSNTSSLTLNESAYDMYWETLEKRAQLTNSIVSVDSTYRDSLPHYRPKDPRYTLPRSRVESVGSVSSSYSDASHFTQTSERIFINNVRMPPQFSTPMPPPTVVLPSRFGRASPPRPPRTQKTLELPF